MAASPADPSAPAMTANVAAAALLSIGRIAASIMATDPLSNMGHRALRSLVQPAEAEQSRETEGLDCFGLRSSSYSGQVGGCAPRNDRGEWALYLTGSRAKTSAPFAGMSSNAEYGRPRSGGPSELIPKGLPVAFVL
jgi:hypothetical protein